jgi:hypothetical protein
MFGGNRTVAGVIVALIVILGIGAAVGGSKKKTSPPKTFIAGGSFRAVVVPADRPRTVVVTPCNAPPKGASITMPGATAIRLPAGAGIRTVLVPKCAASTGTQLNGAANTASAAFVLKPDQQVRTGPHVVVPSQSAADTIVVPPCRSATAGAQREVVLTPRGGTAVAPAC